MIGFHGAEPPAVAAAYDFSDVGTIVDVGGASGHLLTTIVQRPGGQERTAEEYDALLGKAGFRLNRMCRRRPP